MEYITQRVTPDTARRYLHYLDTYVGEKKINTPEDITAIFKGVEKGRNWLAKSIRNLLNFYVEAKSMDESVANKFKKACKIERSGVRAIFISDDEVREAYTHTVASRRKEVQIFFELLVYSGIRASHAAEMLKNYDENQLIKIPEKGIARYPIVEFSRGNKRGFFAYLPLAFAEELERIKKLDYKYLVEAIRYNRVSANSIRKWHYNKLIESGIDTSIADFIQGRAPQSVGAMHYLASARQADQAYSKAVEAIKRVIE
ncbi:hypothetical protein GACE_1156 [Geoglobus acetivorans]|uniref:Integrase SSV1 C-terminal domain-containing protein n=1 Tax=Geoglobus acetivorans TaxID=565033 RepID=A0A0A7GEB2_GEOAI|nr:hypothetical protein GACE_1156 [Geoglobus acetivorans]